MLLQSCALLLPAPPSMWHIHQRPWLLPPQPVRARRAWVCVQVLLVVLLREGWWGWRRQVLLTHLAGPHPCHGGGCEPLLLLLLLPLVVVVVGEGKRRRQGRAWAGRHSQARRQLVGCCWCWPRRVRLLAQDMEDLLQLLRCGIH
jgi:hypothetical protein